MVRKKFFFILWAVILSGFVTVGSGWAQMDWEYSVLPEGTLGATKANGSVLIDLDILPSQLDETLRHEYVHQLFRTRLGETSNRAVNWLYANSRLAKFSEEAMAEAFATGRASHAVNFAGTYMKSGEDVLMLIGESYFVFGTVTGVGAETGVLVSEMGD